MGPQVVLAIALFVNQNLQNMRAHNVFQFLYPKAIYFLRDVHQWDLWVFVYFTVLFRIQIHSPIRIKYCAEKLNLKQSTSPFRGSEKKNYPQPCLPCGQRNTEQYTLLKVLWINQNHISTSMYNAPNTRVDYTEKCWIYSINFINCSVFYMWYY